MPAPWLSRALAQLRKEVDAYRPDRADDADGWIGDSAHAGRKSDHNPDPHTGCVRALDLTDDRNGTSITADDLARVLVEHLRRTQDPRISYVIFDGRMFASYATRYRRAWEWGPYSGPNPHKSHCHISTLPTADYDAAGWGFTIPKGTTVLTNDQADQLKRTMDAAHVGAIRAQAAQQTADRNERKLDALLRHFGVKAP